MFSPKSYTVLSLVSFILVSFLTKPVYAQQYFENPLILKPSDGLNLRNIWDVNHDKLGFLWIGGMNGLLRYDGQFFKEFKHAPNDSTTILDGIVSAIFYEEEAEKLWLGHWGLPGGFSVLDLNTEKFKRYPYDPLNTKRVPAEDVYWIYKDNFGQIWAGTRSNGMVKFNEKNDNFELFTYQPLPNERNYSYTLHNRFESYCQDLTNDSLIWIGTGAGLLKFNVLTHKFRRYALRKEPSNHFGVRSLHFHANGKIYLGLWGAGLFSFDPVTEQFTKCKWYGFGGPQGQDSHVLQSIVSKSIDRLWITTSLGLIEYDIPTEQTVKAWKNNLGEDKLYGVDKIDGKGRLFVSYYNVLAIYDPLRQQIQPHDLPHPDESKPYIFRRFVEDESTGLIWAACQGSEGLYRLDPRTGEWKVFPPAPSDHDTTRSFDAWDILRTSKGELLLLERQKIYTFLEAEQKIVPFELQPNAAGAIYRRIIEDRNGNLWIGTHNGGLIKIDPQNKTIDRYYEELIHSDFKAPGALWDLREDRNGNIWMRGRGCLVYDVRKDTFYNFPYFFPDTKVLRHVESIGLDGAGNVWALGHDQIIGRTDADHPEKGFVSFLEPENGLQLFKPRFMAADAKGNVWLINKDMEKIDARTGVSSFFHSDYLYGRYMWGIDRISNGRMVVGFKKTIGIFHPDSLRTDLTPPQPYVSSFRVFEEERETELPLYKTKDLYLAPGENFFSFTISAINPSFMPGITYRYQMEGVDPDWVDPGERRYIAYTDLSPGDYVFRLKALNQIGVESKEPYTLNVHIAAPWYRTWLAYLAYLFVLGILTYQISRFFNRRRALKLSLARQQEEAAQLKKLDEFKSRFFANITHEFRTPLTIIQGLADQIGQEAQGKAREKTRLIKRNSKKLLGLINQLLDLSKLEANKLEISYIQADIIPYLRYQVQSFYSVSSNKQIQLSFQTEMEQLWMDFDPGKIEQIVSNLLSNALKFTPRQGKVQVVAKYLEQNDSPFLEVSVWDTGLGISEKKLPFLFERFYQVDDSTTRKGEGTGIGLALVKELVQLMGGHIEVTSEVGSGSCFSVQLPITRNAPEQNDRPSQKASAMEKPLVLNSKKGTKKQPSREAPTILLVEDNRDVIYYLRTCLENQYQILEASDGEEGLSMALNDQPDLIISDVMMPKMDGYTLCRQLKQNEAANHIPVILLTAKAGDTNRKEGLRYGADAYLAKPFDPEELLIRIEHLLIQRTNLKKKYWKSAKIRRLEDMKISVESQSFIERLDDCILENISDPKFKVDQLAAAMFMSRSTLLHEMKKAVGKTPSQYLNQARLDLADQLLQQTNFTIAAIADQTGFSSDSYFTKKYEAEFGCKPSERRKQFS